MNPEQLLMQGVRNGHAVEGAKNKSCAKFTKTVHDRLCGSHSCQIIHEVMNKINCLLF